jgi:gluconolactonase
MFFDQNFGASPQKSSTVELDPSGSYRNITQGKMQTNGLYPYKNGNLIVCDMMGHRVVEMTTNGQVVKVLADKYEGKSIDGSLQWKQKSFSLVVQFIMLLLKEK